MLRMCCEHLMSFKRLAKARWAVLPVRQQAIFFSAIGFAWNCVLSLYAGAGPQQLHSFDAHHKLIKSSPVQFSAQNRLGTR